MVGVFDLVISVALFIISRKGVGGVGSGRELGAEDPNCKGAISMRAVRPTHDPESEGQCIVDPLLQLSSLSLSLSAGLHSSSVDIHCDKVGRPGPSWLP